MLNEHLYIIKDFLELLQGMDITLRQSKGTFGKWEEALNSILEENIKALDRLEKRWEKVQEQRKREIEKIRKEVQGIGGLLVKMYNCDIDNSEDCNKLMGKSWVKIDKLLDKLE